MMSSTLPRSIYLDANATTHVLPAAIAAATRVTASQFGNPSSTPSHGIAAKAVLDQARQAAAQVIGAGDGEVVFTSGATEGIQTAVLSALCDVRERRALGQTTGHLLIYGATEHKAVPQALAHYCAERTNPALSGSMCCPVLDRAASAIRSSPQAMTGRDR